MLAIPFQMRKGESRTVHKVEVVLDSSIGPWVKGKFFSPCLQAAILASYNKISTGGNRMSKLDNAHCSGMMDDKAPVSLQGIGLI